MTRSTCSPSRPKSAERIEGATCGVLGSSAGTPRKLTQTGVPYDGSRLRSGAAAGNVPARQGAERLLSASGYQTGGEVRMTKRLTAALLCALTAFAFGGVATAQAKRLPYKDAKALAKRLAERQVRGRDVISFHLQHASRLSATALVFPYDDRTT